jgi:hypothetical protein
MQEGDAPVRRDRSAAGVRCRPQSPVERVAAAGDAVLYGRFAGHQSEQQRIAPVAG